MFKDNFLTAKLKQKYKDEQVFVVPYALTSDISDKFSIIKNANLNKWDNQGKYIFRYDAEYNQSVNQLIPYILITNNDESKFFVAERIAGDERLLKTLSLGFGGHINPEDGLTNVIMNSLNRELNEELDITIIKNKKPVFIGYVRDLLSNTNEHLGLVFALKVRYAKIKEVENLKGKWMTHAELINKYVFFENWSKHIIDHLFINKMFLFENKGAI